MLEKKDRYNLAIAGATGAVGRKIYVFFLHGTLILKADLLLFSKRPVNLATLEPWDR